MSARRQVVPLILFALAFGPALIGCSTAYRYGAWPNIENLARLQHGATTDEIRQALGEPRGRGEAYLAVYRDAIWFYEFGEGSANEGRMKYLFVFVRDGRYDGYFWFDTLMKLEKRD